jgi:hypothetical protein
MRQILISLGVVLLVAGLAWPWLAKLGLGRLPGDIVIQHGDSRFYFPIVSCLVVSIAVTVVFWLFRK